MLLKEMFSTISGPKTANDSIDWVSDLKFFIDNEDSLLTQHIFPTVRKHKKHVGNPDVYKMYINPIKCCLKEYCKKFNIDDIKDKFPRNTLENIAREIAANQETFIKNGNYGKYKETERS